MSRQQVPATPSTEKESNDKKFPVKKSTHKAKHIVRNLLNSTGIEINGSNPWDIQVKNEQLYQRVLMGGSLELGNSYMDGWFECEQLDEFFAKLIRAKINKKIHVSDVLRIISFRLFNLQSRKRAWIVGKRHYDIGNELYELMLDSYMNYSCGYWKNAQTLEQAQINKMDLICKKLKLQPGMRLLDIGCGWGGMARYAAEHYGVEVIGITISEQQQAYASEKCKGLPVEIRLQDYRDLNLEVDSIVSIGMFEHVGHKNYVNFMKIAHRCLSEEGLFLLHTIGSNSYRAVNNDPWIERYIFPNGELPNVNQITRSLKERFVIEDWHNFGAYYDLTLQQWYKNFQQHWPKLKNNYDERFYRMWCYYLSCCSGTFRARRTQLWQIVLSKNGVLGGYESVR